MFGQYRTPNTDGGGMDATLAVVLIAGGYFALLAFIGWMASK